jgi:hypothetical protein
MTGGTPVWLGKLGATLGSGPTVVGLAVGGLVIGTIGSLTLGGRADPGAVVSDPLPLFACPDGQTVIGQVQPGEQVLVTARSADGSWLQVHFPDGLQARAWGERAAFTLDTDPGSLPVADCTPASAAPGGPGASLTITANYSPSPPPTRVPIPPTVAPTEAPLITAPPTATPRPTPTQRPTATPRGTPKGTPVPTKGATPPPTAAPSPTPTPTQAPDTTPPSLSGLDWGPNTITSSPATGCAVPDDTTTIYVTAADPSGVQSVTLWYDPPGATLGWTAKNMPLLSGNSTNGVYRTTVTTNNNWAFGQFANPERMYFYVVAVDTKANSRQLPTSNYPYVNVVVCFE